MDNYTNNPNNSNEPNQPNQPAHFTQEPEPTPTPPRRRVSSIKIALVLILLGAILLPIGHRTGRNHFVYWNRGIRVAAQSESTQNDQTTMFRNDIQSITILGQSGNVRVQETTDNHITVTTRNITDPQITEANGELTIDTRSDISNINVGFFNIRGRENGRRGGSWGSDAFNVSLGAREVIVYVPSGHFLQGLTIQSSSGNVDINNIAGETLYVRANSGNFTLGNVFFAHNTLYTSSGNMRLSSMHGQTLVANRRSGSFNFTGGSFTTVDIQGSSGTLNFQGYIGEEITVSQHSGRVDITNENTLGNGVNLTTSSGSIRYQTASPLNLFTYRVQVSSGHINVDGLRVSGRNATGGTGAHEMNIRASSGHVNVEFGR